MARKGNRDELDTGPALGDLVGVPDEHLHRHRRPGRGSASNTPLFVGGGIAAFLGGIGIIYFLMHSGPVTASISPPPPAPVPAPVPVAPPPPPPPAIAEAPPPAPPPAAPPPPVEAPPPAPPPPEAVEPPPAPPAAPPPPPPPPAKKKKKVVAKKKPKTDQRNEKALDSAMERLLEQE